MLPARNEAAGLADLLGRVRSACPRAELIVVDDGSTDATGELAAAAGATVITHPYSMGNGAAVKAGARAARGETLVFMDADGQHDPADIPALLAALEQGYDMAVGARAGVDQSSGGRRLGNGALNWLASAMTGYRISDLTSGFRAVRADKFRRYLYLLPNGFSYPTTITMAFFRSGYPVSYVPVHVRERRGDDSKIRFLRDGIRFGVIVLKVGALFSPMRLFLPVSGALAALGLANYAYTWHTARQFTNMSALLLVSAVLSFLIGILSEQVSSLHYRYADDDDRRQPPA